MKTADNIWKLRMYHTLSEFMIVIPIITVFWMDNGLSMTDVFLIQSVFAVVLLTLEVPSGYFADKYGRKLSLTIGSTIYVLAFALMAIGQNFWHFALAEAVFGIGMSLMSGADSALLYDSLIELKKEKQYKKIEGSFFAFTGYSASLAAIIGGLLAAISIRPTFYVQAVVMIPLIAIAFSLKEPEIKKTTDPTNPINIKKIIHFALKEHKEVKWLILYSGFVYSSTLATVWFAQPWWQNLHIPLAYFGLIWAALTGARGLLSNFVTQFENKLGRKNALISLTIFPLVGYLLISIFINHTWAIVFYLFFQLTFAFAGPIIKDYINKIVPSEIRATVLSIQGLAARTSIAIIGPILGYITDTISLQMAMLTSAAIFAIAGLICLLFLKKHKVLGKTFT